MAIVGGSGSGKSWLADRLARAFPDRCTRLTLDDFYRDRSHLSPKVRARINFDNPNAIDWKFFERTACELAAGKDTRIPSYDFATHCRKSRLRWVSAKALVIADGLWLLRRPAIRGFFGLKVFLECSAAIRLKRRLDRDVHSRSRTRSSVQRQFCETVEPMHQRFVEPQRRWADILLGETVSGDAIGALAERIKDSLERCAPPSPPAHKS